MQKAEDVLDPDNEEDKAMLAQLRAKAEAKANSKRREAERTAEANKRPRTKEGGQQKQAEADGTEWADAMRAAGLEVTPEQQRRFTQEMSARRAKAKRAAGAAHRRSRSAGARAPSRSRSPTMR